MASSLKEFRNFFKEFEYEPDPRTLNTIAHIEGAEGKAKFILASAKVEGRDEEIVASMASKMTSAEFKAMADRQDAIAKGDAINKRLVIYFGSAGTGKTTKAMADNPTAEVIIGSASQDPDDLFSRFDPATKTYVLTALGIADGFQVIVTMNLETNFGKTPLPSPLVSRAKEIVDFDAIADKDELIASWVYGA